MLKVENIKKKFTKLTKKKEHIEFYANNGISFEAHDGEIVGILGPNGAGKTTLIRLICGLQKPTSGTYCIYGISSESKKITESRKRIGAIIETPSICLDMTAEDNLKEQCKVVGLPSYDNLHELLKLVDLAKTGK